MHSGMRIGFGFLVAAIVVGLSGCASTSEITAETRAIVDDQWRGLDAAAVCCGDYKEVSYAEIPDAGLRFSIGEGDARLFGTDKSYFRGFILPDSLRTGRILVKAHANTHRKHGLPYVLRPSLVVLDAQLRELQRVSDIPLCYTQGWSQAETGYFGLVNIDASASRIVFFAAQSTRNRSIDFGNSATTAGGGSVVTVSVDYQFPLAPVGELEIMPMTDKMTESLGKRCPQLFR